MYIRTPRIGAVCSTDPNDIQALAGDFAYELRQFFKTDRDGERRRATSAAIDAFDKAGDDPEALQAFVDGVGLEAIQAYCLPFMNFSLAPSGDYGFWPDLAGLDYAARSKNGVIKVNAGDAWRPRQQWSGSSSAPSPVAAYHHENLRREPAGVECCLDPVAHVVSYRGCAGSVEGPHRCGCRNDNIAALVRLDDLSEADPVKVGVRMLVVRA